MAACLQVANFNIRRLPDEGQHDLIFRYNIPW
jgi:hypothetical protein